MVRLVLLVTALMVTGSATAATPAFSEGRDVDYVGPVSLHRHGYGREEEDERRWWSHRFGEDEEEDGEHRGRRHHGYGDEESDAREHERGRHGRHEHFYPDDDESYPSGRRHEHRGEREKSKGERPAISVVHQLRGGTELFVSGILNWVNSLVGLDAAPFVVIDTTFSFAKSEGTDVDHGVCGGEDAVGQLFPFIEKVVKNPHGQILTDEDAKSITWTPLSACTKESEVEGSLYATVQVTCQGRALLNVSVSTSGSTPTIKGNPIDLSGVFVDVNLLDGQIKTVEAQGSIIGVLATRHYPENADDVLDKWANIVTQCAQDKALVVAGAVGGGWTKFVPVEDFSGQFNATAVGFTETFKFSFEAPTETVPPSASLAELAHDAAAAYVQHTTVSCDYHQQALPTCHGQDVVSMAQLHSFHCRESSDPRVAASESAVHAHLLAASPLLAGGFLFLAMVAFVTVAQRRRSGYERLVTQEAV